MEYEQGVWDKVVWDEGYVDRYFDLTDERDWRRKLTSFLGVKTGDATTEESDDKEEEEVGDKDRCAIEESKEDDVVDELDDIRVPDSEVCESWRVNAVAIKSSSTVSARWTRWIQSQTRGNTSLSPLWDRARYTSKEIKKKKKIFELK